MSELIVADMWGRLQPAALHKKAPLPPSRVGEKFGLWAGRDPYIQFPGGTVLQFDLSRLTLQDYRGMRDHYQLSICQAMLAFTMYQLDWSIKCENKRIATTIEDNIRKLWAPLVRGASQAYWAGYCVTPDTPVLCADLAWKPAGTLAAGDEILAFDDKATPGEGSKASRRYGVATITRNNATMKPCGRVRTETADPVVASDDHPWLAWRNNANSERVVAKSGARAGLPRTTQWPGLTWVQSKDLRPGDQVAFFGNPWKKEETREAGWLAGMFDGEGWLSRHVEPNRLVPAWKLGIAQNRGPVLDKLRAALARRGFDFSCRPQRGGECQTLVLRGGWRELIRFLGTIAPDRLARNLPAVLADRQALSRTRTYELVTVTAIEDVGEQEVSSITTSSGTFITGGFLTHNSPIAVEYDNDVPAGRTVVTRFKDLIPEECRVNWKQIDGWAPPGRQAPRLNEYDGIKQFGMSAPIPADSTLWYPLMMENGDHYGRKLMRPAFPPWFFSQLIHLFSNRYFERFGEPVPVGRADFEDEVAGPDNTTITGKEAMENILTSLRNRSVVVLPSDREIRGDGKKGDYTYDIEYLESQMRGADFERYLTRLDEEMSLSMFTPLLVTRTADVGSYNLGVGHLQSYQMMLNALAGDFKFYVDNYVVNRLKTINFGVRAPEAQFVYRSLGRSNVEILQAIVGQSLRSGQIKPDVIELGQAVGLTFTETHEVIAKPGVPTTDTPTAPAKQDTRNGVPRNRPKAAGAVARQVKARLAPQVTKALKEGAFGEGFAPSLGYERQMADEIGGEAAATMYRRLAAWVSDAAGAPWAGQNEFMAAFERTIEGEINDLDLDAA